MPFKNIISEFMECFKFLLTKIKQWNFWDCIDPKNKDKLKSFTRVNPSWATKAMTSESKAT